MSAPGGSRVHVLNLFMPAEHSVILNGIQSH
jgi:hypothetical protein